MTRSSMRLPTRYERVRLNVWGPELEATRRLAGLARRSGGGPIRCEVAWQHTDGEPLPDGLPLAPPLTDAALHDCTRHARHLRRALPLPLLLVNPWLVAARGPLHIVDFMQRLHVTAGCLLALDVGHLLGHQLARGLAPDDGLERMPWEAVAELHLGGAEIMTRGALTWLRPDPRWPVPDAVRALHEVIAPRCTAARATVYQASSGGGAVGVVSEQRDRALEARRRVTTRPGTMTQEPCPDRALAWDTFVKVYAGEPDPSPAAAAEHALRLSALAARLDATHPRARAALLPDLEALTAFAAAPELRAAYRDMPMTLAERFNRWARRVLTEVPRPEIAALLDEDIATNAMPSLVSRDEDTV